jgi:hypothetical protein
MPETFATMIDKERGRLQKALEELRAKQEELQAQRATIENELDALDTYEAAKSGKRRKSKKLASITVTTARVLMSHLLMGFIPGHGIVGARRQRRCPV